MNSNKMLYCKCGCKKKLRKDNKTGFIAKHKKCEMCDQKVKRADTECCSKSCSAKLHWQRHPEMKESRVWNKARNYTRHLNRATWVENISKSRLGLDPWNKGLVGVQVAWNKGLPSHQQPAYGYKATKETIAKVKKTNLERHGRENVGYLAKPSKISKIEKDFAELLPDGYINNDLVGKYRVDYVNHDEMKIVEIYGDYWHCNPAKYSPGFIHPHSGKTAHQKWEFDKARQLCLEALGYEVQIIWEMDAKEMVRAGCSIEL